MKVTNSSLTKLKCIVPIRSATYWEELFAFAEIQANKLLESGKHGTQIQPIVWAREGLTLSLCAQYKPHTVANSAFSVAGDYFPNDKGKVSERTGHINLAYSLREPATPETTQLFKQNLGAALVHELVHAIQHQVNPKAYSADLPPAVIKQHLQELEPRLPTSWTTEKKRQAVMYYFHPAEVEARALQFKYLSRFCIHRNLSTVLARMQDSTPGYIYAQMFDKQREIIKTQGLSFPKDF